MAPGNKFRGGGPIMRLLTPREQQEEAEWKTEHSLERGGAKNLDIEILQSTLSSSVGKYKKIANKYKLEYAAKKNVKKQIVEQNTA